MKVKKNNRVLILLLILVLGISVGYAALASNLKINGNTGIKNATWSVYWDNVQVTEGSVSADDNHKARITDTEKTQVEYSVVLSEPGDFYEFTVDAVNNGTIDAMIDENGIVNGIYTDSTYQTKLTTIPKALKYSVTYADGSEIKDKHLLAKKSGSNPTRETYKVRVEYSEEVASDDLGDTDQVFYFKFSVNYVQADSNAVMKPFITFVSGVDGETVGDEVSIGKEHFIVIDNNDNEKTLLAKYNLLVGYDYDGSTYTEISSSEKGYGLQNSDVIGWTPYSDVRGAVAFSGKSYWSDDSNKLLSKYGEQESIPWTNNNIYDEDYSVAPTNYEISGGNYVLSSGNDNYSVSYYIKSYVQSLKNIGAKNIYGRLLTAKEAESFNCSMNGWSCSTGPSWLYSSSYWLGSAFMNNNVWGITSVGNYMQLPNNQIGLYAMGVRPVIVVSK